MKICEWCGKEHDGSYKTGRFCSSYCSHAYSANKRKENWRENVSKAQKGKKERDNSGYCIERTLLYGLSNSYKSSKDKGLKLTRKA